ncbi:MAG: AsmA-like C-terminal domain-containing protein [Alphaproteobacteria bacterium]|nr:AsmA-like C-terminal domain-containing protein [Alphaproteobacteria bacterium]MDE2110843.1 AsmA-like C-terminal domain-containing protein [Alphaproteobacteria bacterium]MDE2495483.1 AsmA-like C-terminal domain-containing protein [Alphaproteobacteria bacterium]
MILRRYIKAHHVNRAALIAAGTAAALLFFVIGAGIRLLIGPVSLGPFGGALADALARALPGITVKYDQAAIEWARDEGRVNLVILGTRVFDADGRIIAQAPKADIDLAAEPFLKGKVVVKRIALVGVQLTLVRTKEGGLRLGVEKDKQEHDILSRISDALSATNSNTSSLESFAVHNARLALFDEATGLFVVAPQANFRLAAAGANLNAKLDAAVEISGHPAHVTAEFTFPPKKGRVEGAVTVTGFDIAALAANSGTFAAAKSAALKLDLSASFAFENKQLISADFGAGASGSFVVAGVKNNRVRVHSLRAIGRYDAASGRLLLEDATINSDKIKARLQGWLDLVKGKTATIDAIRADLQMDRLSLALPGVFAQPLELQLVNLRGTWLPGQNELVIDHLGVNGAPLSMMASGSVTLAQNRSPAVRIKGTLAPIGVRDLLRYWPLMAAPGARDWLTENMFAGTVGPATIAADIPVGALDNGVLPAGALDVKFALAGGEVNYIKGLTHLTQIQGTVRVTDNSFIADISSARIGPLAVTSGKFSIPDMYAAGEAGDVAAHVQGTMPDILSLIDLPPLGYPTRFGVSPADTKGTAVVDMNFRVPMLKNLNVDDVKIGIKAVVSGFAIALGPHTHLTDGAVNFVIDNNKLHAIGTTGIGGSPSRLALDWTEDFKTTGAVTTRIVVKGSLDEQACAALDLHTQDYLRGPIGLSGTLTGHRGALKQANLMLDLTPTTVSFDLIGVNKPAGFPTTARLNVAFGAHSVPSTETLHVSGPGTNVSAILNYDSNGNLTQLQAPTVRIGPQDDFSLNVTRGSSGVDVTIHGRSLDGSRLAKHGTSGNNEKFEGPFHLNAKLTRLVLRDGVVISPFALDVSGIADRPASLSLSGALSKTAIVTASITAMDTSRHLTFATNDMALLSRGLFGFNSLRGGKFDLDATLPGKVTDTGPKADNIPDFDGKMTLKDFRVIDQPFLARLFSAGSLGGLINLMQGQGIAVDTLDVPFSSRNGVISILDAHATGPAIGVSGDGYIDRPKNDIALKGTLVPMYTINSVLGNIPLLGDVFTSKQGEGIFGMTYGVSGNADEPSVSVNPLSALAPGILRRIFEGRIPNAAQAPSNAPKPVPPATIPEPKPKSN